jgi:hypothetical protein
LDLPCTNKQQFFFLRHFTGIGMILYVHTYLPVQFFFLVDIIESSKRRCWKLNWFSSVVRGSLSDRLTFFSKKKKES